MVFSEPSYGHCFFHPGEDETITPTTFRVCGECGHAWQTEQEWKDDVRGMCEQMGWTVPADVDLPFCTFCAHDF